MMIVMMMMIMVKIMNFSFVACLKRQKFVGVIYGQGRFLKFWRPETMKPTGLVCEQESNQIYGI